MDKVFGFFTKKRRKQSFFHTPFDVLPIQVYKNHEFDSDFENKLKCELNLSEDGCTSHLFDSDLENVSLNGQKATFEKADKSAKNMLVINIMNCKYFHIGPQETINVLQNGEDTGKECSLLPVDLDLLLDCCQKISEQSIMVISLHIGDNWKRFGTSLGLKENYLEEVKCRNDENTVLTTFDILQKYISLFPNTSVGFIVNILYEIKQMKIIREIAKSENFM